MGGLCTAPASQPAADNEVAASERPPAAPAVRQKVDHPLYTKWEVYEAPGITINGNTWTELEGTKLEPLLDNLDLIDLAFIVENTEAGLPVPRCQDVPKGARINRQNLGRIKTSPSTFVLAVLVLSYPWLDLGHPDKNLATMKRCLKCFKAFLQGVTRYGVGCTVGLMMDFPCLPQKNIDGVDDRTPEEKARFKSALHTINQWYLHPHTTTLIFDVELPEEGFGHSNLRPYLQRGWCTFELRVSCLVKCMFCLWSLQGYEKGGSERTWGSAVQDAKSVILRAAPMTPPKFAKLLRDGVAREEIAFTAKADLDLVIEQYHEAFNAGFSEAVELLYCHLDWRDDHILELAEALKYAREHGLLRKAKTVNIRGNACSDLGIKAVREAIEGTTIELP